MCLISNRGCKQAYIIHYLHFPLASMARTRDGLHLLISLYSNSFTICCQKPSLQFYWHMLIWPKSHLDPRVTLNLALTFAGSEDVTAAKAAFSIICLTLCSSLCKFSSIVSVPLSICDGPSDVTCSDSVKQVILVQYDGSRESRALIAFTGMARIPTGQKIQSRRWNNE